MMLSLLLILTIATTYFIVRINDLEAEPVAVRDDQPAARLRPKS
jgi:hypothetical protein